MYTRYFGLAEKPFAISPNPRYLFMSELHREALAHLLYGINSDGCFILLTGDVGTGKTTVCRCLLTQLPEHTDVAIVLNPKLTATELLRTICEELGILPEGDAASMKTYVDVLNQHLLTAHAKGRTTAIIIDEAQNLDMNVLEQLRLLTNLETNTQKLLQIVLIGQPELRDILERPELSQLNQRVTSRYHLTPLSPDHVRTYILHRLTVAGGTNKRLFSPKAIKYIAKVTNGIPRLINVLCDRALLGAYAENEDHVSYGIVKKAGTEVFAKNTKGEGTFWQPATVATIAVAICLLLSALYFSPFLEELGVLEPKSGTINKLSEPAVGTPEATVTTPETMEQQPQPVATQPDPPPEPSSNKQQTEKIAVGEEHTAQILELKTHQGVFLAKTETGIPGNTDGHLAEQGGTVDISVPYQLPKLGQSSII